jgi:hypothetical protein
MLQNAKQLQRLGFYFVVSGLKIIGYGNADNNLESHFISGSLKKGNASLVIVMVLAAWAGHAARIC